MSSIPKIPSVCEQLWALLFFGLFLASIRKGFGIRAFVQWHMGMGSSEPQPGFAALVGTK